MAELELDHVAVRSTDRRRAARCLADLLGAQPGAEFGPWAPVPVAGGPAVLFHEGEPFALGHLAFRVDEPAFERALASARTQGLDHGSAPGVRDGRVAQTPAGRRVYIRDPDGNSFEFMTPGMPSHD